MEISDKESEITHQLMSSSYDSDYFDIGQMKKDFEKAVEELTSSSYDSDYFDIGQMKKDFEKAVEDDTRYWRENDAKFRAVEQKVASYEEFRDIVLASHLKPLDKSDKINGKFSQPWNTLVQQNQTEKDQPSSTETQQSSKEDEFKIPKNSNEFIIEWRRLKDSSQKQCQFLLAIGTSKLSEFFKLDIAHGLLGQIIKILNLHYSNMKTEEILEILEVLSISQRFSLSLLFFSSQEKDICKNLFENLKKDLEKSENSDMMQTMEKLKKRYSEIL